MIMANILTKPATIATSITAIVGAYILVAGLVEAQFKDYVRADTFQQHLNATDQYRLAREKERLAEKRLAIEDKISEIEDAIDILKAVDNLGPRERLTLNRLQNRRAKFLRRLDDINRHRN